MATAQAFGARVKRVEDPKFLAGQSQYVEGISLPNMLGVAFVRSPHAHARIKSIDVTKALALKGVYRVLTGEEANKICKAIRVDVPPGKFPGAYKACDFPVIATGKVLFVGDIVAAVVADNRYVAEDGVELVEVDYEPLPAAIDPEKAALAVADYTSAISWAAQTALRDVIGKTMLSDMLEGREKISDELRKMIIARGSAMEIAKIAIAQGMKTLRVVALEKVREGTTTLEQVLVATASH